MTLDAGSTSGSDRSFTRAVAHPDLHSDADGTLSVLVLRAICVALDRAGVDTRSLLTDLGVAPSLLQQGEARLPAGVVFRALERAPELTGDECFCLRAADAIPLGTMEVLDFAMRSSQTMGEALARIVRYYALIDDASELRIEKDGDVARIAGYRTTRPSPLRATELLFSLIVNRGKQLTGRPWPLREVCFVRSAPLDARTHERFFGAPVRFAQRRNEIVFEARWLDVPCLTRDPPLALFFDRHASALLRRLPAPAGFLDVVRGAIAESMRGSDPHLQVTAKRLSVSVRTLQRRLEEHGTSHKRLLDEVRRDSATKLLSDRSIGIGEVAYLLGFFDVSTFHRAFKRWTGSTPAEYRSLASRR